MWTDSSGNVDVDEDNYFLDDNFPHEEKLSLTT